MGKEQDAKKWPLRQDVYEKVTGAAKYADDLKIPGILYVQAVRGRFSHARILGIDAEKAKAAPGVVGVFTAGDYAKLFAAQYDKPILVKEYIKCAGDAVALVVAETQKQANAAARLVDIDLEQLPSLNSVEEAMADGAMLVHDENGSNLACTHLIEKGDIQQGFKEADQVFEREYRIGRVMHSAIEPDSAVVVPANGGITVYCAGKAPFWTRSAIAQYIGLQENQVRVIQPAIGGSFGGKNVDIQVLAARAAVAALLTGRPCKTTWSREEVLIEGTKRHPFTLKYKVGVKNDGKLTAMQIDGYIDAGAYLTTTKATVWRSATEATGPYNVDNVRTHIAGYYTNNPLSDAVRGFGSPQVDFASESIMDEIAAELGISPIEMRRKNVYHDGAVTATNQTLEEVNVSACLDKLEENFSMTVTETTNPHTIRGRGMSCIFRGEGKGAAFAARDGSTVIVNVNKDGSVQVASGIAEMGQGGSNIVMQVVADTLGVSLDSLRCSPVDTAYVSDSDPTAGSRGTITFGNAARVAANDVKMKISLALAQEWDVAEESITFEDGFIKTKDDKCRIAFTEAPRICQKYCANLTGFGEWSLPPVYWDAENNCGSAYASFNYAACGAEVEIDLLTGKVFVTELTAIHDAGHVLNEPEAKGQILGGVSMALGLALLENVQMKNGHLKTTNFDDYLLPTAFDIGEFDGIIIDYRDAPNPIGVKGIGESSTAAIAPAITNAISDALGVRIRSLPADLETVFEAIQNLKEKEVAH